MTKWAAIRLRYTLFPTDREIVHKSDALWTAISQEPPDQVRLSPRIPHYLASAPYNEGTLALEIIADRLNWHWFAEDSVETSSTEPSLRVLGDAEEMIGAFSEMLSQWFASPDLPIGSRMAFGAELAVPVDNRESGYRVLQEFLPDVTLDPVNSADFLYQINRPRVLLLGNEKIPVNRLTKWSVMRVVQGTVMIGMSPIIQQASLPEVYAARLELDINTGALYQGAFDGEAQAEVFASLIKLGKEIAQEGDRP